MRIMNISDTYLPKVDGVVTSIKNFSYLLAKKGHHIGIMAPSPRKSYHDQSEPNIEIFRFKAVSFPSYEEVRVPVPHIKKVSLVIKEFRPDIIHIHTPSTLGIMGMIIAKRYKIPVITTYHTSIPEIMVYFSPIKILKLDKLSARLNSTLKKITSYDESRLFETVDDFLKDFKGSINGFKKRTKTREPLSRKTVWAITNQFYNLSDLIIAPSKTIERELLAHKVKPDVIVVSNGIETSKFEKKGQYPDKVTKLLHVGRVSFEKKVDIIVKSMKIIQKRCPDVILSIVGDGPAMDTLKTFVKKHKIKNIIFTGYIDRDMLPQIYRDHDVFITASEMETQGIVLLEAMSSGLPVIGADVLAIPDLVKPEKTGFLFEKRDYKGLSDSVAKISGDPDLVKKMGNQARIEAENHDVLLMADKLEKVYESII